MIILGLTGSIGMGKSNAALALRRLGLPIHDSDLEVHKLLAKGGRAVRPVAAAFPRALVNGAIDRRVLGDLVFGDTPALRRLEGILHPLVRQSSRAFLMRAARRQMPIVVLDIPLLYESGGERIVDAVIVVSAPARVQRLRVLARRGMTAEKFHAILSRQVPDAVKRRRATFLVRTGGHRGQTFSQLYHIVRQIRRQWAAGWRGDHWPPVRGRFGRPKITGK